MAANATWSLQERLPGAVPDVVTVGHMGQLLALAERHAGAAPEPRKDAWLAGQLPYLEHSLSRIVGDGRTRPLALELSAVLADHDAVALLNNGIVHSDFHHRNFLALDDEVTAVFDWEFASVGDWRYDLVTLAFWSVLIPWQIPPDVADIAVARMRDRSPADLRALLTAVRAINQLDYDLRTKPDSLDSFVERVEREVAPWWRAVE